MSSRFPKAPITRSLRQLNSIQSRHYAKFPSSIFSISDEVTDAIQSGKPVVALETTIYTHGFPYPDNVSLATHLESVVRINGGIPATIGILNGVARVGLSQGELVELASAAGKEETMKVSRRDIPFITGLVSPSKVLYASKIDEILGNSG
jgi:pseudouridine-5'-phosphate glycosidase/pseudouridine kinase